MCSSAHPCPLPRMSLSVTQPIDPALRRTYRLLFRPFNLLTWLGLTTSVFLSTFYSLAGDLDLLRAFLQPQSTWLSIIHVLLPTWQQNPYLAVLATVVVLLVGLSLVVLVTWVCCRGEFIFLDNVVHRRGAVLAPWQQYHLHANSLLQLRLLIALIAFAFIATAVGVPSLIVYQDLADTANDAVPLPVSLIATGLVFCCIFLVSLADSMATWFVAPLMYLHHVRVWPACHYFIRSILLPHLGSFLLFYLTSFVLLCAGLALLTLLILLSCCTCCCALLLPYVKFAVLLPLFVFFRYYSLCFLAQCGPACDVLRLEAASAEA
ncbi:MAG: hypothetical protein N2595_01990 [bacterium]|nr:hypothetical protein [bacterium]